MLDLPGPPDVRAARRVVDVVRECGARERVYYCAGAAAMLAVRAADPAAEIALTWTTLAPPRPALLDAVRPRWLNYRFGLVDRALAERVHARRLPASVWTPDTRRTMRRLIDTGVDSITTNRVDVLCALRDGALGDGGLPDGGLRVGGLRVGGLRVGGPREPAAVRRPGV